MIINKTASEHQNCEEKAQNAIKPQQPMSITQSIFKDFFLFWFLRPRRMLVEIFLIMQHKWLNYSNGTFLPLRRMYCKEWLEINWWHRSWSDMSSLECPLWSPKVACWARCNSIIVWPREHWQCWKEQRYQRMARPHMKFIKTVANCFYIEHAVGKRRRRELNAQLCRAGEIPLPLYAPKSCPRPLS